LIAPSITLINDESTCTILPSIGGGIGSWTVAGQDMLRAASPQAIRGAEPLGLSTFPLVPYSNRIANAGFAWMGKDIRLTANFCPEPHAIHGIGWRRKWDIEDTADTTASLMIVHTPDADWPWAFEARQAISIAPDSLTITMRVRNCADHSVPLAFGHHPYFDAIGASLQFEASRVWMTGDDGLPAAPVLPSGQFDFSKPRGVQDRDIDHCYAGVRGSARITWEGRPLALDISSTPQLQAAVVYIPKGGEAFCFEPVPHINNALNLPGHEPAMPVVETGGIFETTIVMKAIPRPDVHANTARR
jgi:aldose 1-epimerase